LALKSEKLEQMPFCHSHPLTSQITYCPKPDGYDSWTTLR